MVLTWNIQDGRHFEVHFFIFSLIFRKSVNDFLDNTIFSYMIVSLLIFEIYLLLALLVM